MNELLIRELGRRRTQRGHDQGRINARRGRKELKMTTRKQSQKSLLFLTN